MGEKDTVSAEKDAAIKVRVRSDLRRTYEELAHERSSPGDSVPMSELFRTALWEYLESQNALPEERAD